MIRRGFSVTAHRLLFALPFTPYIYEKGDQNRFGIFAVRNAIFGRVVSVRSGEKKSRDLTTKNEIALAKRKAMRMLLHCAFDALLILPRRVKRVFKKKK